MQHFYRLFPVSYLSPVNYCTRVRGSDMVEDTEHGPSAYILGLGVAFRIKKISPYKRRIATDAAVNVTHSYLN